MKTKIWYISKYANIKPFGADTRQSMLCKQFAKAGMEVRLVLSNASHLYDSLPMFDGHYFDQEFEGFNVTWINTPKYSKATSIKRLLGWLYFELMVIWSLITKKYPKPDVVIASSLSLFSIISGAFIKRFYGAKLIFEVRDIWPQTLIDLKGLSPKHPLVMVLGSIEKFAYKYADEIVGTMPGLEDHVKSVVTTDCRVTCIPQGVDLSFYEEHQEDIDIAYNASYIPNDKFIVTYTGTFGSANALDHIIDAAKLIEVQGYRDIHFLFVGDGYLKENLVLYARGISNITFAPKVKKTQVQSILAISDVLVAAVQDEPIYKYGLSLNKFIDYMFASKPIVAMYSGYPSMINEANCGLFTPADDSESFAQAIIDLYSKSSDELNAIGRRGHQFVVTQREISVIARKYMELL
ncbi:glycosyltransferase [Aliivibrio fischeri]|uniref:glycosyltransferase family 4 protein n=1 Tax=Aliivibrio fischeri TaxID=668 RepID=UPI0012DADCDA|nr:glycosyltransferase family 4 protein [Aliivibrio fischeri]MUK39973.1 glycosyltransferase [Aliivibrio fischeri]